LAAGRSLKFASCRVGLGECSYPRTVTAIHLVVVDRTPNLPIERRTLYHTELMSVEHDKVSGSRSKWILQFRTRSGSDSISKKLYRIKYGYPNRVDHCSQMLNQRVFSDGNRIGSNIWTVLPDQDRTGLHS